MQQQPDRLVAFLDALENRIASQVDGGEGARQFVRALVDEATERNLAAAPELVVPEGFDRTSKEPQEGEYAYWLHQLAYALTGAPANTRRAVSQIGGNGVAQELHPGYVDELVARVADEIAREKS